MSDLIQIQQQLKGLRSERDHQETQLRRDQQSLLKLDKQIAMLERQAAGDNAQGMLQELKAQRESLQSDIKENKVQWQNSKSTAWGNLAELMPSPPWELVEQLPDHTPFLLMPVKIETKFARNAQGGHELWVRIFPDAVAVSSHEEDLMDIELEGGKAFWTSIWEQGNQDASKLEEAKKGAWNALANSFSAQRSSYIAWKTRPLNWSDDVGNVAQLQFPDVGPTKAAGWTQAPRTKVLPDRFVVSTFTKNGESYSEALPPFVGKHVPDTLALGPDPAQLEESFSRDKESGELNLDPDMAWLTDFDKAVDVGMGMKIPLKAPFTASGFDRLVVLGLRLSDHATDNARMLEELLEGQRFSSGVAFTPQGTATNNSEDVGSGFTSFDPSNEHSYLVMASAADPAEWLNTTEPTQKPDGQRFADALGLSYAPIAPIENSNREDIAEAMAMNAALWPATGGEHLKEMLGQAFDSATRDKIERFFLDHVSGRGFLPAFRVGTQPYGVLLSSSLDRWQWSKQETGEGLPFQNKLLQQLRQLSSIWKDLAKAVKYAGDSNEPFQRLLDIVGLNATSVEYFSRKASTDDYVWNYYNFQGTLWQYFNVTWVEMVKRKMSNLNAVGLGGVDDLKLWELMFLKEREHLYGPIVDDDPDLALSELDGIRPYYEDEVLNEKRNYINWLLISSLDTIEKEKFLNKAGEVVPSPKALLYMFLRQSLLNQVVRSGKDWLVSENLATAIPANPNLLNINGQKNLSGKDLLNVSVPAMAGSLLGENIVEMARTPAALNFHTTWWPVAETRKAMERLAGLPTARLERLFAEHIDLCSYRMDAWINGVFHQRLESQRKAIQISDVDGTGGPGQHQGIYLGAYGWVENLKPRKSPPQAVSLESIPEELRKPEKGPIVSDPANGGFILSPSMNHAVAGAILRNAYISHADKDHDSAFAVNLSSRRVRTAMSYMEGMRNGQSLAALLGYQLERALHDNPGGLELDQYIYTLRDRFPYSAGKLAEVPEGTAAEAVEANNVVNGYDLLHAVKDKSYPYGMPVQPGNTNGLPAAGSAEAKAIVKEIDRLAESLDAIADLALSESVYQVVQGNYERAGGMLQALAEGKAPPEADIVKTPRNGKTITQRVAFTLKPDAPSVAPGWDRSTLRATANAPVNDLMSRMLPARNNIGFEIDANGSKKDMKLSQVFDLQPIDLVLMSGNNLGDQSSELERYLIYKIKVLESLGESDTLTIDFRKKGTAEHNLYLLQPLLRSLRRLITESRPMQAQDLLTGIEAQKIAQDNPKGWLVDVNAFQARVQAIYNRIKTETDETGTGLAEFYASQIATPFQLWFDDPDHVIDASWEARLNAIRDKLLPLLELALPEALPATRSGFDRPSLEGLVSQVQSVLKVLKKRLKEVDDSQLLQPLVIDPSWKAADKAGAIDISMSNYGKAARILMNQSYIAIPFFNSHNTAELDSCKAQNIEPKSLELEKWLQGIAKVRDKMGNLCTLSTTFELLSDKELNLHVLQLPFDATAKWVGREFGDFMPEDDSTSIVLHAVEDPDFSSRLCGLLLDEWTEVIPEKEVDAGISFHFNRPNAMPPQTLLLAVTPQISGKWEWDDLMAILHETLERAKLRAVEPNQLLASNTFQTLPAVMTEFTNFDFRTVLANNTITRIAT